MDKFGLILALVFSSNLATASSAYERYIQGSSPVDEYENEPLGAILEERALEEQDLIYDQLDSYFDEVDEETDARLESRLNYRDDDYERESFGETDYESAYEYEQEYETEVEI